MLPTIDKPPSAAEVRCLPIKMQRLDYFMPSRFFNKADHTIIVTAHTEEIANSESTDTSIGNSDLLYKIEIKRKAC